VINSPRNGMLRTQYGKKFHNDKDNLILCIQLIFNKFNKINEIKLN